MGLLAAAGCGGHRAAPPEPANQVEPGGARPAAGTLTFAAGGSVGVDQAFVWAVDDPEEHVTWISAVLVGGRSTPLDCDRVWHTEDLGRFSLRIAAKDLEGAAVEDGDEDEYPETVDGWNSGATATGRPELVPGELDFHMAVVDVESRQAEQWILGVKVVEGSDEDAAPLAWGRFEATWCGVVDTMPLDPEGD